MYPDAETKEITPQWQPEPKIGIRTRNELIMRVQTMNPHIFTKRAAFDGMKNLFAPLNYFPEQTFRVPFFQDSRKDQKEKVVAVHIKHVNKVNFGSLQQYIRTERSSDEEVNLMLNMLNVFVQATPKQKEGILSNAKSIFVRSERKQSSQIAPLELWRGYFQSVRPAFDKLVINVDVTIGVVLPAADLEKVCAEYLHLRNRNDLKRLRPDQFQKLRQFLKGLKVRVNIGNHKHKTSVKTVRKVIQDVGIETFEKDGEQVTVADHFMRAHNFSIPRSTLGIETKDGKFPITCCSTEEQLYKNRATPEVVRAALEFTPSDPRQRANEINRAFKHFDYANSHFLVTAGIEIRETPEMIKGRMLGTPSIVFGTGERNLNQRPGVWDVMRQRLASPAQISRWIVIDFASVDPAAVHYFVGELLQAMRNLGIQVPNPEGVERRSTQGDVLQELESLRHRHNPSLIVAILPDPAEEQYRTIKRFGDITWGVATQCVRWSNNLSRNVSSRKVNQYQNNLILKINPKLGGVNFSPNSPVLQKLKGMPFMVIGADVSHPGPGSQLPSIASVVASFDRNACQYAASISVQSSRVEVIENFSEMFLDVLNSFRGRNSGAVPKIIIVFRDGVSEGEFDNVARHEKEAMEGVFDQTYPEGKRPKIVHMVVGKRHHVRFFPTNPGQADNRGNGNFKAGLVVDNEIVHPRYCDFYLQSQPGLKGTSIPSHYTVIRNDLGMTMVELQELAYSLCHAYSRSTRSVKVPAPVYYADLVCRRAKFHYDASINDYSVSSASGYEDDDSQLNYYRQHFNPVNSSMKTQMYFV
ncbi:argonaute-like protein [Agaricus bisporus var. bisporus H97]|uniref:argonaute-like protein n=1 Tax=Agaricus bisporus var. bisporus (strain H97 / ATCC MYA-4626 / FGSC 10389) TaxID=936046 RepID=UPI00029F7159|nr:argonaute-like protein [Agaricus bisporus var. bisporus H97]EKV50222.1 argonaute-like protein [Agaricus bisporus var. bisporus H97]